MRRQVPVSKLRGALVSASPEHLSDPIRAQRERPSTPQHSQALAGRAAVRAGEPWRPWPTALRNGHVEIPGSRERLSAPLHPLHSSRPGYRDRTRAFLFSSRPWPRRCLQRRGCHRVPASRRCAPVSALDRGHRPEPCRRCWPVVGQGPFFNNLPAWRWRHWNAIRPCRNERGGFAPSASLRVCPRTPRRHDRWLRHGMCATGHRLVQRDTTSDGTARVWTQPK